MSYYAVATSLIALVGDYLFADRMRQDRANADRLAVEAAPLYLSAQMPALQARLEDASGELGGRLMVLDGSGKVQLDSYSELNGSRMELPEVASILAQGKTGDYGVHKLRGDSSLPAPFLAFLRPYDPNAQWVGYCTSSITENGRTVAVLLFSSPLQEMMQRLFQLQDFQQVAEADKFIGEIAVNIQPAYPQTMVEGFTCGKAARFDKTRSAG